MKPTFSGEGEPGSRGYDNPTVQTKGRVPTRSLVSDDDYRDMVRMFPVMRNAMFTKPWMSVISDRKVTS